MNADEIFRIVLDAQRAVKADTREDSIRAAVSSAVGAILREGYFQGENYTCPAISTVSGTFNYQLHADVARVISVRITEGTTNDFLPFKDADELEAERYSGSPISSAKPHTWSVEGETLVLFPTPNAVYTITVKAERKAGDISLIPDQFLDVVLYGAQSIFNPAYIPIFEKGKHEVKAYYRKELEKQIEFQKDESVQAHERWQMVNNVY